MKRTCDPDADNALDITMAEWRRMTGHADDSGVPTTYVQLLVPRTGQATLVLHYWNVIDNKFVEDEVRQRVTAINPPLLADVSRDGAISDEDAALQTTGVPFRFWYNEDTVKGDYVGQIGNGDFNRWDNVVNGKSDLVNLFPLEVDVSELVREWGDEARFRLRARSRGLRFCVLNGLLPENVAAMQTSQVRTDRNEPLESAVLQELDYGGTNLTSVLASGDSRVVLAFEASAAIDEGSAPLLVVSFGDREVFAYRIPLSISSVDGMYRFCNIRSAASNPSFVPTVPGQAVEWSEDGQDVDLFFTHGFNVSLDDARNWGRILFKRFWHSGLNARFHMLTWEGNYSILPGERFNALHYQHDVWYALRTGGALKRYIEAAQPDSTKRVLMTQSLGNMVACEALKEGLHVGHYFMFDAALPGESIDESLQARSLESPAFVKYVPTDWHDYTNACWASNWHRLFNGDPDDARGRMGWPGYFTTALGNADNVYNYYSSGDDVFKEFGAVPSRFDGLDEAKELYCWQKQETLKGSAVLAGTAYAGWAFHHWTVHELVHDIGGGVHYEDRDYKYSPDDAARMIANGSITNNPVFNSDFSPMFDPDASLDDQWLALGKYVPAVSSPVGGNAFLGNDDDHDLNSPEYRNGWGRALDHQYGTDWQHSDMMDMAYYYVFKLYEQLILKGGF